jgi:Cu-Zn family superoxide dismutase
MRRIGRWIALAVAATACSPGDAREANRAATPEGTAGAQETARAVMRDARGRELGTVTLEQTPSGVLITGALSGLPPGEHGFHIHAVGRCEPDFQAAGSHYNPMDRQHGFRNPRGPHAGDLPNIHVGADGRAAFDFVTGAVTLRGGQAPLLDRDGSAVLVHAGPDDYATDPAGDSGDRIACGVIMP